jgi:hypothetical protein
MGAKVFWESVEKLKKLKNNILIFWHLIPLKMKNKETNA